MDNPKKKLYFLNYCYLGLAMLTIMLIILNFLVPSVAEELFKTKYSAIDIGNMKPTTALAISYATEIVIYLWNFWLIKRILKGKSKGTFVMVLLTLGLIAGFIDQFGKFNISTLIAIFINAYVLQVIYFVRNEK